MWHFGHGRYVRNVAGLRLNARQGLQVGDGAVGAQASEPSEVANGAADAVLSVRATAVEDG